LPKLSSLYATEEALLMYFDIKSYESTFSTCNPKNHKNFELLYNKLHLNLHYHVSMSQLCYALEVNHQQQFEKCAIVRTRHWIVDISFEEWTVNIHNPIRTDGQLPLVSWLEFRPVDGIDSEIGCFAKRNFAQGEIIAMFCGKKLLKNEKPSPYAFTNKYGTYDALRGFYGDGAPVYNMGVHIMRTAFFAEQSSDNNSTQVTEQNDESMECDKTTESKKTLQSIISEPHNNLNRDYDIINAVLCEDFIVRSLRAIECDEEITISYDKSIIIRPGGYPKNNQPRYVQMAV
jgi:hypothetical protein